MSVNLIAGVLLVLAPGVAAESGRGKLDWFQGSFEALLAEAEASERVVLVDLWTEWCGWCRRLGRETFSNAQVLAETKDVLCWNADAESAAGAPIARRFAVSEYPALIVLGPDGALRDRIGGYLAPQDFVREMRRVRADRDTLPDLRRRIAEDPSDVERRYALAKKLEDLGDRGGARAEIEKIEELDPQGRSLAMHRIAFEKTIDEIDRIWQRTRQLDTAPLALLLEQERHPEVLFEGWKRMNKMHAHLMQAAVKDGREAEAKELRARMRASARRAWQSCPEDERARFGNQIAWDYWEMRAELSPEEKSFALDVARRSAAGDDVHLIDTLACCLYMNGRVEEARQQTRRCIELDPQNRKWRTRLESFQESR
jgi:tetratricopeptide (TPR) repeat protein